MVNHQQRIEKANQAIQRAKKKIVNTKHRQKYHFMPPANWMNDPNGLIQYNGIYHLFYQHNPYDATWGSMHWGHAVSKDFLNWKHLPIALAPSEPYDDDPEGGCFSGTAIVNDNKMHLFYTGTIIKNGKMIQTQCLATSTDFVHFEKHPKNPIIELDVEGADSSNFRDPKVWFAEETGEYYMIVGTSINGKGNVLLYKSMDLLEWECLGPLVDYDENLGSMWECPDIFSLEDKYILLFSPMHLDEKTTLYMTGEMDYQSGKFIYDKIGQIDYGFDFYAPQTLLDENGRQLMIGWQNGWEWMPWWQGFGPTSEEGWCGSMSIPRELQLDENGYLTFTPIKELSELGNNLITQVNRKISNEKVKLAENLPPNFEAHFEFDCLKNPVKIIIENHQGNSLVLKLSKESLEFDRSKADSYHSGSCTMPINTNNKGIKIFADTSSIEIFSLDGYSVLTSNVYFETGKRNILISCREEVELTKFRVDELKLNLEVGELDG